MTQKYKYELADRESEIFHHVYFFSNIDKNEHTEKY
jgi:hypothetical protein